MDRYFNEPQKSWGKLFKEHWQTAVSCGVFTLLLFVTYTNVSDNLLARMNDLVISAASVISAILITFLVAKVIQMRQEKLANWNEYHRLTQQVHHFRGAVYALFSSWGFWQDKLKSEMENKYKTLTYYDVRKSVSSNRTPLSGIAQEFIDKEGGMKRLYLELRSFYSGGADISLFADEFDVYKYYELNELELWLAFDCGNGLYSFFKNEYGKYKSDFHFDKISYYEQEQVKKHCLKIDPVRYQNVPFGNTLYNLLGQQFTADILPRLFKVSSIVNARLPKPAYSLSRILPIMIIAGIIIPSLVAMELLSNTFTVLSVSLVLALLLYVALTFYQTLSKEININP